MPRRVVTEPVPAALPRRDKAALGAEPMLAVALDAVLTEWGRAGTHTEQSLARMSETVARFSRRLAAQAVMRFGEVSPVQAAEFVRARTPGGGVPEVATQHARRTAVRTLYRTLRALGYPVGDPALDLQLPARGLLVARPLSDDEVALCRASAQAYSARTAAVRTVAWALGEATAVSSEITAVRIADLCDPADPQRVRLPGTRRHDPRVGELSTWGRRVVAERVAHLLADGATAEAALAYGGAAPPGGAKAQASVCNALRDVLDSAGLGREPDVRPASLRHWAARRAYDSGEPIEAVARLLGSRSLDAAAEDIGLDWRTGPVSR